MRNVPVLSGFTNGWILHALAARGGNFPHALLLGHAGQLAFAGRAERVVFAGLSSEQISALQIYGLVNPAVAGSDSNPADWVDPAGAVASGWDGLGNEHTFMMDRFGNATSHVNPLGDITIERNSDGLPVEITQSGQLR